MDFYTSLSKHPPLLYSNLAKCFVTRELMRWPGIETIYGPSLRVTSVFGDTAEGSKRWDDLHTRVIEHVESFCYSSEHIAT